MTDALRRGLSNSLKKDLQRKMIGEWTAYCNSGLGRERFRFKAYLLWGHKFETISELRKSLLEFHETSNKTRLIERHDIISPAEFRQN